MKNPPKRGGWNAFRLADRAQRVGLVAPPAGLIGDRLDRRPCGITRFARLS